MSTVHVPSGVICGGKKAKSELTIEVIWLVGVT